jgi:hypothetical protein
MPRNNGRDKGRKPPRKREVRRILILCEDTKSSRDYFASFPHDRSQVEIECVGTGMNTDSLMEYAVEKANEARRDRAQYERIWVVFDRDSFPEENFNRAFELARTQKRITPCWSNECFELWYLLHFHYRDTAIGRHDLWPVISELLEEKYDKADESLHATMKGKLDTALRNAKKLAFENGSVGQPRRNPSTLVHELVNALIKLDPSKQQDET